MAKTDADFEAMIDKHFDTIEKFIQVYLAQPSIQLQLQAVAAQHFKGYTACVQSAIRLLNNPAHPTTTRQTVINNAPALELLVRLARMLGPAVLPLALVPSHDVVNAALRLYHHSL